jgi:hypothetical protein
MQLPILQKHNISERSASINSGKNGGHRSLLSEKSLACFGIALVKLVA